MSTRVAVVTGANGFVGSVLCRHLAADGWEVRALVRDPATVAGRADVARGGRAELPDVLDETLLDGASAIVHCAYATKETDLAKAKRVNEGGTRRLREAARRAGVARFVFVSTIAATPDAPNYYARSKAELERVLDPQRDLVLRPGLVIGRDGHGLFRLLMDLMQKLHLVPLFDGGRQPLQTVHVDDVGEALVRALRLGVTGAVNVAEPDPPTIGAFLRNAAKRLRIRVVFLPLPFGPVLAGVKACEKLGVPFPLRSESLLGLAGLRRVPVEDDLRRLGMHARSADESLAAVLGG
ncbi:MAG: NAD-dependent epimerase/dehydratase family protein [bacterium]|nr:NAD-dependent epimerase/dehydratase family protein [bacterium]